MVQVLELAEKGIELSKPLDMIKDPYMLEFLGLPEQKPIIERFCNYKIQV